MKSGPMLSPKLYHEVFFLRAKKIYRMVKERKDMLVFLHTCGGISEFIPDLIDAGVDILNPVQITAWGMGPGKLKGEFGRDVVFRGRGVDTQHVLPTASPEKVRNEARKNVEIFMKGAKNILAIYDEVNRIEY